MPTSNHETEVERKLREANAQLSMIIESAKEFVIFSLDLNRTITSWNSGANVILGYSHDEAIGQSGDIIFTPEDRAAGIPEREATLAQVNGRSEDERWHVRKDGTLFWSSGAMLPLRDQEDQIVGLCKIFRDRTEQIESAAALERDRKEMMAALQCARAEAEEALHAKDHFLAVLSHELRTPLTPILMVVGSLTRRTDLPDRVRDGLEMIRRNVEIEAHFVDDLLDLTRITRRQFDILRKPLDLHAEIHAAVQISEPDIISKNQQVTTELEAPIHHMVGDPTRLQQVVWNLLKNASKFTPEGGKIHIATRNVADRIQVILKDNGVGIDVAVLPRIFDAFTQGGEDIAREFGGLGLGLAISKATIDAHGGTIEAHSLGKNQGATFTIDLPIEQK